MARVVEANVVGFGTRGLAVWTCKMHACTQPKMRHQDMLDAAVCALICLLWHARPDACSVMLGDVCSGFMVTPISDTTQPRLE